MNKFLTIGVLTCGIFCSNIIPQTRTKQVTPKTAPTPTGVVVTMSDGTSQTFPLGVWMEFASGAGCSPACPGGNQLRGIFPTQYVNQIANVKTNATGSGASITGVATTSNSLTFTIASGGTAYINPQVTVTGGSGNPGIVTATVVNGSITAINAPNASGYTQGDGLIATVIDLGTQTWVYNRPGRNVQVWRNGLLQRQASCSTSANLCGGDYTINTNTMTITPVPVTLSNGNVISNWNLTDYVTVAYLY